LRAGPGGTGKACVATGSIIGVLPLVNTLARGSSCACISSALFQRSPGALARARMITAASAGGTPARSDATGSGRAVRCEARICCPVPAKGGRPATIS
jgi:hypothetical protein